MPLFSQFATVTSRFTNMLDLLPQTRIGGEGDDTLAGRSGDDHLYGNGGRDFLVGNDGNDTLDGGSGNDHLAGGDGNDLLSGGIGSDTLSGGRGDDHMYGGSGADSFSFFAQGGHDVIYDFNPAEGDKLNLANTAHDFTNWVDVDNHGSNFDGGCVIDLGGGDSVTLLGVSIEDVLDSIIM